MRKIKLIFCMMMFLIFTGCGLNNNTDDEAITHLYIAHVLDESTENTSAANEWLRQELSNYLGIEVVQIDEVSHLIGIEAMRAGHLDVMFASAFTAVNAQDVVDIEIAGTLNHSQVNPLNTVFITNQDDIHTLADFKGRTFAFVNPTSASGFFFPAFHLVQNFGLDGELITMPGHFFFDVVFSGSQETSISGVSFGDYDGAAVLSTVLQGVLNSGVVDNDNIRIVYELPPSPDSSYIMRADLPADIKDGIRSFFQTLDNPQYFLDAWGFEDLRYIEGNYEDLDNIRLMREALGLED